MVKSLPHSFDRTNAVVAFGVWLVAVVIYSITKAPTLSFWDCGEFIATCHILGIPHPPGTPLFVMVGRLFSLLPISDDISGRINFLSSLCSSVAALFAYLAAVRILRYWFTDDRSPYSRFLVYAGAACGALFLAFGRTQWNNSVETEVYGMSMMMLFAIVWLTLVYFEHRGTNLGEKLLLLIVYLAFLGIGVHMTTFLVLPVSALVFVLKKDTPLRFWFLTASFFIAEFYLIFALSSRVGEIPYYVPIVLGFILYTFYILSFDRIPARLLVVGLGFLISSLPAAAALAGYNAQIWSILGLIAFAGLLIYGTIVVVKSISAWKVSGRIESQSLVTAVFIFATGLFAAILVSELRGYAAFLMMSLALAVILGVILRRYLRWPVLIALAGTSLVIIGMREYFLGSLVALVVSLLLGLRFKSEGWKTAIMIVLVAAAGFSVHTFIPIRSALHPAINENNPSQSLGRTISYLERKQYGSQDMIERMFVRRAGWNHAFGNWHRMAFWGFFSEQYGLAGKSFLVVFLLGVFGAWEACRRKPQAGLYIVVLLLVATVGLVLYMNFADGARQHPVTGADYLEVRNRDYFFTPGFMVFGMAIGLGLAGLVQFVRDLSKRLGPIPRGVVNTAMPLVFLAPVLAIAGNYYYCDRSQNYIPYDYAANLLISADQNAVLFTNGDNDTFPLWCLQEVYGVRQDVRVVNLALANTDWYIRQIRDHMGLELGWDDAQVEALRPFRYPDGRVFRIQDQVIDAIVAHNASRVPINYSVTCASSARKLNGVNIDSLLEMRAMAFRLTDSSGEIRVNIETTLHDLTDPDRFRYRGWNDPSIYKDETTFRLTANVAGTFLMLAESLRRQERMDEAVDVVRFAVEKIPHADDAVEALASLYALRGDPEKLEQLIGQSDHRDKRYLQGLLARAWRNSGDNDRARQVLFGLLERYPDYRPALNELMALLLAERDVQAMLTTLQTWVANNPGDQEMKRALGSLLNEINALSPPQGDSL